MEQAQRERDEAQQERDAYLATFGCLNRLRASKPTLLRPKQLYLQTLPSQQCIDQRAGYEAICGSSATLKQVEQAQRERDEVQQERDAANRGWRGREAAEN